MRILNTWCGLSGLNLLGRVSETGDAVDVNGQLLMLVPRTLPFSNRAEISTADEATFVGVRSAYSKGETLVRVIRD